MGFPGCTLHHAVLASQKHRRSGPVIYDASPLPLVLLRLIKVGGFYKRLTICTVARALTIKTYLYGLKDGLGGRCQQAGQSAHVMVIDQSLLVPASGAIHPSYAVRPTRPYKRIGLVAERGNENEATYRQRVDASQ